MKKHLFYLSAIVFFVTFAENNGSPDLHKLEHSHYDIQLKIIPAEQFIQVSGSLKLGFWGLHPPRERIKSVPQELS